MSIKKVGKYIEYHQDGVTPNLMSEYDTNSNKTGTWTLYYQNGDIHIKCKYVNNKLHGTHTEYRENNDIVKQIHFEDGKMILCKSWKNRTNKLDK